MSTHRVRPDAGWGVAKDHPRGPNGRFICRCGCGVEVPKGRRTFASPLCVHEWKLRTNPGYLRDAVQERDRGVCAACGLDTGALRREVNDRKSVWYRSQATRDRLVSLGFDAHAYQAGEFWNADHILSVVEGGGCCGLSNIQTLCVPCHKRKTRELAARQKEKRDAERKQDPRG